MKSTTVTVVQNSGVLLLTPCEKTIACKDIQMVKEGYFIQNCCGDPYVQVDDTTVGAIRYTIILLWDNTIYLSSALIEDINAVCDGCECA